MVERREVEGVGKWLALRRTDGQLVGRGGFTRFELGGVPTLELGWAVRDALTGNGYATEMGRAALDWARTFLPGVPVIAFTDVHNVASRAVMRRLGMREVGIIHREGLVEGHPGPHPEAPFRALPGRLMAPVLDEPAGTSGTR